MWVTGYGPARPSVAVSQLNAQESNSCSAHNARSLSWSPVSAVILKKSAPMPVTKSLGVIIDALVSESKGKQVKTKAPFFNVFYIARQQEGWPRYRAGLWNENVLITTCEPIWLTCSLIADVANLSATNRHHTIAYRCLDYGKYCPWWAEPSHINYQSRKCSTTY